MRNIGLILRLLVIAALLMSIPACGGGGGGGGAVYSAAGMWQMVASNSPQAVIGARLTLASDGTGKVDLYGTKVNLVWAQDGNTLTMTFYDSNDYLTSSVKLSWKGPDKFTWKTVDGTTATYVRIGNARTPLALPRGQTPKHDQGYVAQQIGIAK